VAQSGSNFLGKLPDSRAVFPVEFFAAKKFRRSRRLLDPAKVDVGNLAQVDLIQNILESLKVELTLNFRVEHPDTKTETNDVDVNLLAGLKSAMIRFDQKGFDARLERKPLF